jgi:hypothetical protein
MGFPIWNFLLGIENFPLRKSPTGNLLQGISYKECPTRNVLRGISSPVGSWLYRFGFLPTGSTDFQTEGFFKRMDRRPNLPICLASYASELFSRSGRRGAGAKQFVPAAWMGEGALPL